MAKVCRICGKRFIGDVLKHFEEQHFDIYAANRDKIAAHPNAFAVVENGVSADETIVSVRAEITAKKKREHRFSKGRMKVVVSILDRYREEQTYRREEEFKCYTCSKKHKHGKVIYGDSQHYYLCYECYKHAKKRLNSKRGNKHAFINTPM